MDSSHHRSPGRPLASAFARVTFASAALVCSGLALAQPQADVRLARYTTASPVPEPAQADPLEAIVQVGFPRATVATVGEAVAYLLARTGYRLGPPDTIDEAARDLLAMPLPEVHRRLGPYPVRTALSVLLGPPFVLSVDPVRRQLSCRAASPGDSGRASVAVEPEITSATRNGGTR